MTTRRKHGKSTSPIRTWRFSFVHSSERAESAPKEVYRIYLFLICCKFVSYRWSIETRARSSLCLLLNITSFWGISSKLGGPKGAHIANRAKGGSSVFLFCPWSTLIRPRMSSLLKSEKRKKITLVNLNVTFLMYVLLRQYRCFFK